MKYLLIILFMPCLCLWANDHEINVYYYHDKAPYVVNQDLEIGLYFDLLRQLNDAQDKHVFRLRYMPRKRIESNLALKTLKGLTIGANPVWFKDKKRKKYRWSIPFLEDQDVVISHNDRPVTYTGPKSLIGRVIGGNLGYYYYGIDELVNKGQIKRFDALNDDNLIQMVTSGRVQAAIVSERSLEYYFSLNSGLKKEITYSQKPHDRFKRFFLIPMNYSHIVPQLNNSLKKVINSKQWDKTIKFYKE